jgi:hexosaminidase
MSRFLWIGKFTVIALLVFLIGTTGAQPKIIPKPSTMTTGTGTFTLPATLVVNLDAASDSIYPWIYKLFTQAGATVRTGATAGAQVIVTKSAALSATIGTEGYNLTITTTSITIAAASYTGQLYAVQTLRQMLPPDIEKVKVTTAVTLPVVTISDKPRFGYRGSMLDPARRFLTIDIIKSHIDRMSLFKMNRLHLHLSDDQGWRLEIKSYPLLTSKGATTQVNQSGGTNWFYSQVQMADIIKYAKLRGVEIVPEFDMPGHVQAALASYPTLARAGANTDLYTGINTGFSSLNCGSAAVNSFVSSLYTEVAALFPGNIIHVGGDEAQSTVPADYNTFIKMAEGVINSKGKVMMGWEEILKAGLAASSLPQAWNIGASGKICSWCDHLFIDHANNAADAHAMGWCTSTVPLQNVYNAAVTNSWTGVECCCWGEYIDNYTYLDRRNFPRLAAAAELGWTPTNTNWSEFAARIAPFGCRFDDMGIAWYTADNSVAWQRCTANPTPTSLFTNFDPSTITSVTAPSVKNGLMRTVWTSTDKIVDIRGRVVGTIGDQAARLSHSIGHGVYFYVKDRSNGGSQAKVLLGE